MSNYNPGGGGGSGGAPSGSATGDLTGSYPAPVVSYAANQTLAFTANSVAPYGATNVSLNLSALGTGSVNVTGAGSGGNGSGSGTVNTTTPLFQVTDSGGTIRTKLLPTGVQTWSIANNGYGVGSIGFAASGSTAAVQILSSGGIGLSVGTNTGQGGAIGTTGGGTSLSFPAGSVVTQFVGGIGVIPTLKTASATLSAALAYYKFNITASATATLPTAPANGTELRIKNALASTATLTVAPGSGDTLDTAAASLSAGAAVIINYDATNKVWDIV